MRYNKVLKGCNTMMYLMRMCLIDIVEFPKGELRSDKLTGFVIQRSKKRDVKSDN